jgi:hypothetical protein
MLAACDEGSTFLTIPAGPGRLGTWPRPPCMAPNSRLAQLPRAARTAALLTWSERWRATAYAVPRCAVGRRGAERRPGRAARGDQGPGPGPEPGHAERVAAERTTAAGNRGARQRAASPG